MNDEVDEDLLKLAQYLGIQTEYKNAFGTTIKAGSSVLITIINSIGIKIKNASKAKEVLIQLILEKITQKINLINVLWDGKGDLIVYLKKEELSLPVDYELRLEDGSLIEKKSNRMRHKHKEKMVDEEGIIYFEKKIKTPQVPFGYHELILYLGNNKYSSFLISAPRQMYTDTLIGGKKLFGLFAPIYALHDDKSLGCGDLGTLSRFSRWLASKNATIVATMPFFSSFLKDHFEPSPYSPVSRIFWNELYLDIDSLDCPSKDTKLKVGVNQKSDRVINLKEVAALKRKFIERGIKEYLTQPKVKKEFQKYIDEHPELKAYALFHAQNECLKKNWHAWSKKQKDGVLEIKEISQSVYDYHLFVQWKMVKQLTALKKQLNDQGQLFYLDLPVGIHKEGFDAWYFKTDFISNMSIGAPPDPKYQQGQNWGSPPLNPIAIRKNKYAYLIKILRRILPLADILRIDHVMGFDRLYWIPDNNRAQEGVYVHYNSKEIYAILSIESHRHKTVLIGENLGLVPKSTEQMMQKHSMLRMHIIQYLLDSKVSLAPKSKLMLASLNTHDMPTFTSYLNAADIKKNYENKILSAETYKKECANRIKSIKQLKKITQKDSGFSLMQSTLKFLAESDAQILIINIEDLWQEPFAQNTPGQANEVNWRRALAFSLKEISKNSEVNSILDHIKKWRSPILEQKGLVGSHDIYLFNEGRHFKLYNHLGAHLVTKDGVTGTYFGVWAPNAEHVSVMGSFNSWSKKEHRMHQVEDSGIWELFIPEAQAGDLYKFFIRSKYQNFSSERSDPFAFYQEVAPKTASVIWQSSYEWSDEQWLSKRYALQNIHSPISIYEVHIGSWKRVVEENNRYFTYRELAPVLTEHILAMNFTHVEFLPIMEHPFYGSWGYQILGYFAPSSRYGTPDDFKYLIDYLHQHDIGVIIDWVPSHFPNDLHGLAYFDGTHLFEHADPKKGFHPDWKSAIFNYGRHEVRSFLISSALFWLENYHIDGIRVDAVASMLYLDYSRKEGEWAPNAYGGNENLEAVDFLKELNQVVYAYFPDVQTFAEESTAWPGVSRPTYLGGLGFGFKWDMGWMHDTLSYLRRDPIHRGYHQHQLSFRMIYAFTENFVLSLSHDEVVHGKGSLLNKMPGNEWEQFANLRLLYGYMYAMPGKKLLFMGNEFGQRSEWDHERSLDWHVLQYSFHKELLQWVARLNLLYKTEKALYDLDHDTLGFEWIDVSDVQNSVYSFLRKSHDEVILIILNCTPIMRQKYRVGVPPSRAWHLLLSSDGKEFGGGEQFLTELPVEQVPFHNQQQSSVFNIPGLSVGFYKCTH